MSRNGIAINFLQIYSQTHLRALLVPRLELLRGEVGPSICAGNGPGQAMWPAWNETTVAAFYGKMLGAVKRKRQGNEYLIYSICMYKACCLHSIRLTLVSLSICLSSSGMVAFVGLSVCSRKDTIRCRNDQCLI